MLTEDRDMIDQRDSRTKTLGQCLYTNFVELKDSTTTKKNAEINLLLPVPIQRTSYYSYLMTISLCFYNLNVQLNKTKTTDQVENPENTAISANIYLNSTHDIHLMR